MWCSSNEGKEGAAIFQKSTIIPQKNIKKRLEYFSFILLFIFCFIFSTNAKADLSKCRDPELQKKIEQVAKEEGVNPRELLSIIAHESQCNYFVIAWNFPHAPQTAKNKFFESLAEAKSFAEELISTKKYRVDIGIGQINYEANIKRKGWNLEKILNPQTALNRVAQVLKERGWMWYHSNNYFYAKRWRQLACNALYQILSGAASSMKTTEELKNTVSFKNNFFEKKKLSFPLKEQRRRSSLLVYKRLALVSSLGTSENLISSLLTL